MNKLFSGIVFAAMLTVSSVQAAEIRTLPAPQTDGGMPLMQAMKMRKTSRMFSDKAIEPQVLSNMLWAAYGINRPSGKRTIPTAKNMQDMDVYVLDATGAWRYEAKDNTLIPVVDKDLRPLLATQAFAARAPVTLAFVADVKPFSWMHAGSAYQDVGLYCAAVGLNNVVRWMDRDSLTKALNLPEGKEVLISQSVGYP